MSVDRPENLVIDTQNALNIINETLSKSFNDYRGMYFFGSRLNNPADKIHKDTDFDLVLIFDFLDYKKLLKIAGVISDIEYQLNIYIDCKLFTASGYKSIEYIRKHLNPLFIKNAIDNGIYYARA
jgi:hypothetical protein